MNKGLNEPNGICFYLHNLEKRLLVCDTNNHRLVSVNLSNGKMNTFSIYDVNYQLKELTVTDSVIVPSIKINQKTVNVLMGQSLQIVLQFNFVNDLKAENGARHKLKIVTKGMSLILWLNSFFKCLFFYHRANCKFANFSHLNDDNHFG